MQLEYSYNILVIYVCSDGKFQTTPNFTWPEICFQSFRHSWKDRSMHFLIFSLDYYRLPSDKFKYPFRLKEEG